MSSKTPPSHSLRLNADDWLRLSMIVFGVIDAQNTDLRRVLAYPDMLTLYKTSGEISSRLMYAPMEEWSRLRVLLTEVEVSVLLKAVQWYDDTLAEQRQAIEREHGINELINRYEICTRLTRAIQTAPTVYSDQRDR